MARGKITTIVTYMIASVSQPSIAINVSTSPFDELAGKTCSNCALIGVEVGMPDDRITPYPEYGYDTSIDYSKNCYVAYPSEIGNRLEYTLHSINESDAVLANTTDLDKGTVFLTHTGPCGVCSNLDDLKVYLTTPDLTNPVRQCGLISNLTRAAECISDIGFSESCSWIWVHNTQNTKQKSNEGGCFEACVVNLAKDNNIPYFSNNTYNAMFDMVLEANPCDPTVCRNTINKGPACTDEQWMDSKYRLNSCLQCDECRSGPIFQKVAGRTRRNSGIESAILRPPGYVSM